MKAAENKVVVIHYTLVSDSGELLDTSSGGEPLAYIHGAGNLVPGLEKAIEGKGVGDAFEVAVGFEEGYGARHDDMIQQVPRSAFQNAEEIEPGMRFQAHTSAGHHVFTVTAVDDEFITADGNHPLAGENLNFSIEIIEIRDATEEELSHGHVHGPDGHHHH